MRHIVIGDIHGCIQELDLLLEKLSTDSTDKIYFIGDLIDRGPDSAGVVKRVRQLSEKMNVTLILGNHEEKFLRYLKNVENNPSALAQMKNVQQYAILAHQLTDADIRFLEGSYYTKIIDVGSGILLLHAGIPATSKVDLATEHSYISQTGKPPKGLELLTKTRRLDEQGNFLALNMEKDDSPFWAEVYDGRWGFVIFGHQPFIQDHPKKFEHALGIDTGCVFGGWLTALVYSEDQISHDFVSVKAMAKYALVYI